MQPGSLMRRLHILIRGRVQGVGFRWHAQQAADQHGITGWARNLADGSVEIQAQGSENPLSDFVKKLKSGPPYARVETLESREVALQTAEERFIIR